jgi:hypothetical protein
MTRFLMTRPRWLLLAAGVVVSVALWLACRDEFRPIALWHMEGSIEGLGRVHGVLQAPEGRHHLALILPDGREWAGLQTEPSMGRTPMVLEGGGWMRDKGDHSTNSLCIGVLSGRVPEFRGVIHAVTPSAKPAALHLVTIAEGRALHRSAGLRIGQRGIRSTARVEALHFMHSSALERAVESQMREGARQVASLFNDNVASMGLRDRIEDLRVQSASQNYTMDSSFVILHRTPEFISLSSSTYDYTGGAHGNYATVSANWLLEGGSLQALQLTDLFQSDSPWEAALSEQIISDLRRQKASSVVDGDLKEFKASEIGTFNVLPAGLRFTFNPYAVGSYAEGSYTVLVPWNALAPLLETNLVKRLSGGSAPCTAPTSVPGSGSGCCHSRGRRHGPAFAVRSFP